MNDNAPKKYDYEDGAEQVTVSGWRCKTCNIIYVSQPPGWGVNAEDVARRCCMRTAPCSTEGCTGRAQRGYRRCPDCRERLDREHWAAKFAEKSAPWREGMLYSGPLDRYFDGPDEWEEFLEDDGFPDGGTGCVTFETARLQLTRPCREGDIPNATEIDAKVNALLQGLGVLSWYPSGIPWNGRIAGDLSSSADNG